MGAPEFKYDVNFNLEQLPEVFLQGQGSPYCEVATTAHLMASGNDNFLQEGVIDPNRPPESDSAPTHYPRYPFLGL